MKHENNKICYTNEKLKEIIEKHKKWLNYEKDGEKADLQGADLRNADLQGANLQSADLQGANLQDADLQGANLRRADLRIADLQRADLQGVDLRSANLQDADLQDADLRRADLRSADLRIADLQRADLRSANLQDADLDFSCLPLWCGSLLANMDDRQVKQLLYHILSIVKHSNNVSETIKAALLTDKNIKIAKEFHRANECNKL